MKSKGSALTTYDTINHLIRDLQLDRDHWINVESFRFNRKHSFDSTTVNIKHVPEELLSFKLKCANGHEFIPDWLRKRHPVSTFYCKKRGLLRQGSNFITCPVCSTKVEFKIPQAKYKGNLEIYGDEAKRTVEGKTIFVYSFISFSGSANSKKSFEKSFLKIKRKLAPSINPKDWVLHMKELTSKEKWQKKSYLNHLQSYEIHDEVVNILRLIGEYNKMGSLNIYSASGIVIGDSLKKEETIECQSNIYNSALMRVVNETTANNLAPKFYFEQTGNDGWAKNLFDGGRLTLLWAFLTNGLPVMSPQFVDPATSLYLEIADIVSYLVARYLFCVGRRVEGKHIIPEFELSQVGKIRYVLTNGDGDWINDISDKYPFELMFKGTSWADHS